MRIITTKTHLFILLITALFIGGCDEEKQCTLQDWVGTYKGVKLCNTQNAVDYTFEIKLPESGLDLPSNTIILDGLYFTVFECMAEDVIFTSASFQETFTGALDEDELNVVHNFGTGSCNWVATKQ